jgi:hypothetical protein
VRRLLSMIMLALAAVTLIPAAGALAALKPPTRPSLQRFGVRLVDVPVSETGNPRAVRYIIDYLPAGTVIHRRILILNTGTRNAHFTVYPDAALISHGLFTGDAGATRNELTSWISVQHPALTLGQDASVMDMITIKVPREATRGERYAVIWVQQVAHAQAANGLGITEVGRVGIRIYLAVGHGGAPPTTFAITSITGHQSASGQSLILAHVHNTGGRAVDLNGTASLTGGSGGISAGSFPAQQIITLAPGQSGNVTFALDKHLSVGLWTAKVALVSGFTRSTASAAIEFSAAAAAPQRTGLPVTLWLAALVLAAALALALVAVFVARHSQRARREPA